MSKQQLNKNETTILEPDWLNALPDADANYMRGGESKLRDEINKTAIQLNSAGQLISGLTDGFLRGLIIKSDATTPNKIVNITINSVVVLKNGLAAYVKDVSDSPDLRDDGAGGLDTSPNVGAQVATVYAIWLIWNDTTDTAKGMFSRSFTDPEMPTGYEYKRLLGYCFTGSADANIEHFFQFNNYVEFGKSTFQVLTDGVGNPSEEIDINSVDSRFLGFAGLVNTVRLRVEFSTATSPPPLDIDNWLLQINQTLEFDGLDFPDRPAAGEEPIGRTLLFPEDEEATLGNSFDIRISDLGKFIYTVQDRNIANLFFYGAWLNL